MRVGIVIDVDYPHVGEIRPTKFARSLTQAGHHVVFICSNSRQQPLVEDLSYGRVYRFGLFLKSKLFGVLSAPSPLNPLWTKWIANVVRKEDLDVLISSNIRIALPTTAAGRMLRKPVVLDLQENNREVVKVYPKTRPHHYITKNSSVVGLLEDICVGIADHTWVVVEERLQAIPPQLRQAGKISVVCHTPALEELRVSQQLPLREPRSIFTLIYFGLFAPGVGSVEPVLRALPHVLRHDPNVRFLIGGKGHEYLLPMVQELNLQNDVSFSGLIEPTNLPSWLQQGELGIIAYPVGPFSNTTISNKLFHYMAAGLPVLSTDMKPTRRILNEVSCGVTFPENATDEDIAAIILRLKNSPQDLLAMGQRGRQAVFEKYNWNHDFTHALECLEKLIAPKTGNGTAVETLKVESRVQGSRR